MKKAVELQLRARRKMANIDRIRRDSRYRRVLGRFVAAGLLVTNEPVALNRDRISVVDVLWAAEAEPRFLELLPALLVKRPSLFTNTNKLPEDLAVAVRRLRRNLDPDEFRGIPGAALKAWLPRVGRKNHVPARLRSFRLKPEDLRMLEFLAQKLQITETSVLRKGLLALVERVENAIIE